jgi:PAS domain S-box-containing protein
MPLETAARLRHKGYREVITVAAPARQLQVDLSALLIESVEDYAIFTLGPDGRIASWNRGAQKLKGYSSQEIIGQHFSKFYPAEDLARGKPARELEIASEEGRVEDEGWRVRKDGSLFWANVIITALRDERGETRGFAKITRDLTARRAADEQLRRSEERFRLLVEAVGDYAIYMLDPEGRVATWNTGAQNLKGYTAREIIGESFAAFFPEADVRAGKPMLELEEALKHGRFEEEGYRVRKDGTRFWANVVLAPVRDAAGQLLGFTKVTRDLTQRLEAERVARELVREQAVRAQAEADEARLREAVQRAEQASRVKDEFLATVSHELRTPLNAILGWASLLRARNPESAMAQGVEVIHRNALAQSKIIEDILDVSRIITGKLRLDVRPADLVVIVQEAIEVVRPSALAKQLSIDFASTAEVCTVMVDPERLQQVIWNLLSNAVKFSERGGCITVAMQSSVSEVVLSVTDRGAGIEPAFLPFVFDRFQQADSSSTRRVGGLGLGLAIVRHLVELHGGRAEAKSKGPGTGATFRVTLPNRALVDVKTPARAGAGTPPHTTDAAAARLSGTRVLVVEDERDGRELLEAVLTSAGAEVATAASAAEGLDLLQRFRPHVLVSDIGMPEEDGYSLIQRVKALPGSAASIPSIALTAFTRAQDKTKALAMGFTTHVSKPVNPDDLVITVANLAMLVPR